MANVFNVRGVHALYGSNVYIHFVLMEREHCRLSQKLEKEVRHVAVCSTSI